MFDNLKIVSLALCLLSASVVFKSPTAHANPLQRGTVMTSPDGVRFQRVHFGDLRLGTPAGDQTLYARIRTAAKRVCSDLDLRPGLRPVTESRCQQAAVANAMASIGVERLTDVDPAQSFHRASLTKTHVQQR